MPIDATVTAAADGTRARFEFTVRNPGDDPIDLRFRSGKSVDFAVLDAGGDEVWRWSDGRMFTQALRSETLDAGESRTFEETWDAPEPGRYEVVATLAADPGAESRAEFEV